MYTKFFLDKFKSKIFNWMILEKFENWLVLYNRKEICLFGIMEKKWRRMRKSRGEAFQRLLSNSVGSIGYYRICVTMHAHKVHPWHEINKVAHEVCIVTQSIGDSGQLAIKPETRCPVVDHVRRSYVSTRIGTVIVSFVSSIVSLSSCDKCIHVLQGNSIRNSVFVMKL